MRSLQTLLTELIDYAGLFPPADLEMSQAVTRYADYRNSLESWMLGRFISPVARLEELERSMRANLSDDIEATPWKVSALTGSDLIADMIVIDDLHRRHTINEGEPRVLVDTIEIKASSVEEIQRAMEILLPTGTIYFEIPIADDPAQLIEAIAREGASAKVRTGGLTPDTFPSSSNLLRFIGRCLERDINFKATAGLHHPVRSVQRLTYEPDSPWGLMHGFLNVFLTAAFMFDGMYPTDALEVLDETASSSFVFEETGVSWRDYKLTNEQIAKARRSFAMTFGSCSFVEPLEDLREMGLR